MKIYWLEDDQDGWPNVPIWAEKVGSQIEIFEDPDEMRDRIESEFKIEECEPQIFLIDLILAKVRSFNDWNGAPQRVQSGHNPTASEAGLRIIEHVLCHPASLVKNSPMAVLTQRIDDGVVRSALNDIIIRTSREQPIRLLSKNKSPEVEVVSWLTNCKRDYDND